MEEAKGRVCLGAVMGAHGVRGEARVKSFCAEPSAIGDYGPLVDDGGRSYRLTVLRPVKGGYAVRLSGVSNREQAEALRGQRFWAPREALPATGDEEFYHADLVGLEAVDTGGAPLGRVRAVHDFGAGDLLELVDGPAAGVLIPFTRAVVPNVDLRAGRLIVDLPEGLLDGGEPGG